MNLRQLSILLADDDPDDCVFFKQALGTLLLSIKLTAVHDGEQLMDQLTNATNILPDILFLDLNMPRKNGFECLSEIKQNENLKDLPVIIFSTSFEQEVVNQLYINGAHYFIRKPSEFSKFKKIILHALTLIVEENGLQPTKENFVITLQENLST